MVTMMPNNAPGAGNRPIQPTQDKVAVKRVGVGSAFKMGCGLSMLLFIIFGGIALVIGIIIALVAPSILGSITSSLTSSVSGQLTGTLTGPLATSLASGVEATAEATASAVGTGTGTVGGSAGLVLVGGQCVFYLVGIFVYGLIGGIVAAIYAIFYNIVGRWLGGIEVELKR